MAAGIVGTTLLAPLAAAATWPVVGTFTWMSWAGLFVGIGILGLIATLGGAGKALVGRVPVVGRMIAASGFAVFVVMALVASAATSDGLLSGFTGGSTASVAGENVSFDAESYEATSDVTFYVADAEDRTTQNAAIKIYASGVDAKKVVEGSAVAQYSGTASSGALTLSGIQTQTLGCTVDVGLDLAGYYEQIERDVNICVAKNPLGNNDISVPTFYIKDIGTLSLASSATTLTCTAGTQCSYSIVIKNTEDDAWATNLAVKWLHVDVEDHTLDSVDAGNCEISEVSGTKYVKFGDDLGPLGFLSCTVKITRASGDTDGGFNMTLNDQFMSYGATAWNTNSNIRSATATAAYETTFA